MRSSGCVDCIERAEIGQARRGQADGVGDLRVDRDKRTGGKTVLDIAGAHQDVGCLNKAGIGQPRLSLPLCQCAAVEAKRAAGPQGSKGVG